MKNIAILITSLNKGGAERSAITQQSILSDLKYRVFFITINDHNEFPETQNNNYYTLDTKSKFNSFSKPFRLSRFLKEKNIDLVIDHRSKLSFIKTLIYETLLKNYKKIKIIHSYNLDNYFFKNKWINRFFYKNYNKLVTVSEEIKEEIVRKFDLENTIRIYNSIPNISTKNHLDNTPNTPYILFFGRLDNTSKNLLFLIESYHKSNLVQHNISLFILGDGPDKADIESKVKQLHLENHVHLHPSLKNPFLFVQNALFTVLTSNYEGFPMAIIESLALGTPVICTNFKSGPSEIIRTGYNGIITDSTSEDFAEGLNAFIYDKNLYNTCKSNAKKSVQHLDKKNISNQWKTMIESLAI